MGIKTPYEIVLTEIKRCNGINEAIWLHKLFDDLDLSRDKINRSVDNLKEFGFIEGQYGETKKGKAGYRYYITEIGTDALNRLFFQ